MNLCRLLIHCFLTALMIHGGGFLTLSRKAVRTRQTKHLLAHGLLPVSVDHRLCPQVNVLDGAMTDARDACLWAQRVLPDIMEPRGITVDRSRYVVVGWSTGGTLAMTTAWTVEQAGGSAPASILAFYCPVSYDPKGRSSVFSLHGPWSRGIYLDKLITRAKNQLTWAPNSTLGPCLSVRSFACYRKSR